MQHEDDIRYLGRLLGEVIREGDGEALFAAIEDVRRASVAARRGGDRAALDARLAGLSLADTLRFVRAYLAFSLLANIAEDRAEPPVPAAATLGGVLGRLGDNAAVAALLDDALVAPVLTAHPTEVRRKSVIDREAAILACLAAREAGDPEAETELIREITLLWQTRPLRAERPGVADEIATALSFFRSGFCPRCRR